MEDRRIPILLVGSAIVLGLSLWLGIMIGRGSHLAVAGIVCGVLFLVTLLSTTRYHLAFLVVLILLPGRGLILGGFGYWDLLALCTIGLWLIRATVNKDLNFSITGKLTLGMITLYCAILVWHYIARFLGVGTGSEGGLRLAVLAMLTMATCLLIQSDKLDSTGNVMIPALALLPGFIEGGIEVLNYFVPSARLYTYILYKSINWEIVHSMVTGGQYEATRLAGLRMLGITIGLFCCARYATRRVITPRSALAMSSGMVVATALVLIAGYRGHLMILFVAGGVAFWARYRCAIVWVAVAVLAAILGLSLIHNYLVPLPYTVQRSLSWFPGDWDPSVVAETSRGWLWRQEIWGRFMTTVFPQRPWLGQGLQYVASKPRNPYIYRLIPELFFVDNQSLHSGFFSTLDFVGIVGLAGLVTVSLRGIYNSFVLLTRYRLKLQTWMIWVVAYFVAIQPTFWITGFFDRSFLPISICAACTELIRKRMRQTAPHSQSRQAIMAQTVPHTPATVTTT